MESLNISDVGLQSRLQTVEQTIHLKIAGHSVLDLILPESLEASQAYRNQMSTLDVNKWRTDYCGYTDVYWLRSEVHFCACFHRWENWLLIWVRVRVRVRVRLCGATYIYIDITLHNK